MPISSMRARTSSRFMSATSSGGPWPSPQQAYRDSIGIATAPKLKRNVWNEGL